MGLGTGSWGWITVTFTFVWIENYKRMLISFGTFFLGLKVWTWMSFWKIERGDIFKLGTFLFGFLKLEYINVEIYSHPISCGLYRTTLLDIICSGKHIMNAYFAWRMAQSWLGFCAFWGHKLPCLTIIPQEYSSEALVGIGVVTWERTRVFVIGQGTLLEDTGIRLLVGAQLHHGWPQPYWLGIVVF